MEYEYYDPSDPNSPRKIPEGPVILDFTGCKYLGEIHQVLKRQLGFPDYYGENLAALWDCLGFYFYNPITIKIYGTTSLPKDLSEEMAEILEIFNEASNISKIRYVLKS